MSFNICSGFGANQSHALILNSGQPNTHPNAGTDYPTISLDNIFALIQQPPSLPKEKGQWIIPSSYHAFDARSHEQQRQKGSYHMLAADIDQGNPSMQEVADRVITALGPKEWFAIYSSRSATEANRKWRVLIPLSGPLSGEQYSAYQAALFDALEHQGLVLDRSLERTGQLIYLPNRGDFYEWQAKGDHMLDALKHPMSKRAKLYIKLAQEALAKTGTDDRQEGSRSPLRAFRQKHSIAEMLSCYGYVQKGNSDHWRSPYQQSQGFATKDNGDHWYSLSDSDAAAGIGRAVANGGRYGDAFDLYIHFQCGGNRDHAMIYARKCLEEEDDARFGCATREHGAQVWDAIQRSRHQQAEILAQKVRELHLEVDPSSLNDKEWSIDWPPGAVGDLAKWIYLGSSRPIKQYSIAAAIYFFSVAGRKYNVDGFGLNLFLMLIGETGRGKGIVKSAIDRICRAIDTRSQNPTLTMPFSYEIPVSESGIRKALMKQNPICAYEEELGQSLIPLNSSRASGNDIGLRKMLTRLYDSGEGRSIGRKEASDQDRVRESVYMPCLTFAGDTQPHIYRALLGNNSIDSGFGPRMVPFFYYGKRKHHNEDSWEYKTPPMPLVDMLKDFLEYCLLSGDAVNHLRWSPEAYQRHKDFGIEVDNYINAGKPGAEMYNRAATSLARMAGIIAVGKNHLDPCIDLESYEYAYQILKLGLDETQRILANGGAGEGEGVRQFKLKEAIKKWFSGMINPDTKRSTYKCPKSIVDNNTYVNELYFIIALGASPDFKGNDNRTTEANIRDSLKEAMAQGIIEPATGLILDARTKQTIYQIGPDF